MKNQDLKTRNKLAMSHLAVVIAGTFAALGTSGTANAFEINTGNPDVEMRWDTQVRYGIARRMQGANPAIANNFTYDEGDATFKKGDVTSSRLDLFSEFDFIFEKKMGFRVSAAAWADSAYGSKDKSNPLVTAQGFAPNYDNNSYTSEVKRYYRGPSGEILDSFVFTNFSVGSVDANVKLGRHAVTWGESLFGSSQAIAYAMGPSDLRKQLSSPNASAKETALPVNQISSTFQLADNFSIAALYTFEFRPDRLPEGGTFYGVDSVLLGPNNTVVNPAYGLNIGRGKPINGKSGDIGLALKWRPEILDGQLGFYYRKFADKSAWTSQLDTTGLLSGGQMVTRPVYANDIEMYGVSLNKEIAGASIGAEVSYRKNGALTPDPNSPPGGGAPGANLEGPRGNTWHALLNAIYSMPKTALWDNAFFATELQYSRLAAVTKNGGQFMAQGYGPTCTSSNDIVAGCTTKDYWNLGISFTPGWNQVFPGVNLEMPMYYGIGLKGNTAYNSGGYEGFRPYFIGLTAKVFEKYQFDLKYNGYAGKTKITPTGSEVLGSAYLADKGALTLSFNTTF